MFTTRVGTPLDTHNVRRDFRKVAEAAGLIAGEWTPRELRHSFVSLLSDDGMPIEHIARLVGHTSTAVTETVYRQQIRPVIVGGAEAMDRIFRESATASEPIVTPRSARPTSLEIGGEVIATVEFREHAAADGCARPWTRLSAHARRRATASAKPREPFFA